VSDELRSRIQDDERLLRRAEKALTEIKVAQGLSEQHASVLAALRIRIKGEAGKSLEDLLTAAGDLGSGKLDELLSSEPGPKRGSSLDDALAKGEKPKRSLDDLFGGGSS
jgi:hypothetical protein